MAWCHSGAWHGMAWSTGGGMEWHDSHDLLQFGSAFVMSLGHQLDVSTYSSSSGIVIVNLVDKQTVRRYSRI